MELPLSSMTTAEKLDAMEQLWTSLQPQSESHCPPDWHAEVLALRQKRIDDGEVDFSDLETVRGRLKNRPS